jgi:hypothetical protein
MTRASYLPLHAQKAVVGKWLWLRVLEPRLSSLEQETVALLDSYLCMKAAAALRKPDSRDSLDAFLTRLAAGVKVQAGQVEEPDRDKAARLAGEFADLVAAFCASPYDPLERLASAVAQTSADFYRGYGAKVPAELWERTSSAFSFLSGRAGLSFAPDIHLAISTTFKSGHPPFAEVWLQLVPEFLNMPTVAVLPRVMLHEYIAHVPQGPYTASRVHPDPTDAFAEGWMDYLAHRVHRAVLDLHGPCQALAGQLVVPPGTHEQAAEAFFKARCALSGADPVAAARSDGAAAARQLHDLLRRLPETKADPDTHLFTFSFGFNSSARDHIDRRSLVAVVRRCLSLASRAGALVAPLRQWAAGAITLERLAEILLAIRSSTDV